MIQLTHESGSTMFIAPDKVVGVVDVSPAGRTRTEVVCLGGNTWIVREDAETVARKLEADRMLSDQ